MKWHKLTGWYVWNEFTKKQFFSANFHELLTEDWRQILRLNAVLDRYTRSWPGKSRGKLDSFEGIQAPQADWGDADVIR